MGSLSIDKERRKADESKRRSLKSVTIEIINQEGVCICRKI